MAVSSRSSMAVSSRSSMAVSSRSKRVTDPLDYRVKARLTGADFFQLSYVSSGSEHSAENSPCLSELIHGFLEDESLTPSPGYDSDSDLVDSGPDRTDAIDEILGFVNANNVDCYRKLLFAHVSKAVEKFSLLRSNKSVLRRNVMAFLRELGHNAAVCKTKWNSSGGLTSGNYEFIDVLRATAGKGQIRYFVELDLVSEFEIARPTVEYSRMLQSLPRMFVGTADELMRIVRAMSDAARRSLRSRELSVSPWRKNRYMQNKWFGSHRRTVNPIPGKTSAPESVGVAYRCVGFDDVVSDVNVKRQFFVRTR